MTGLLPILLLIPLAGAVMAAFLPDGKAARTLALAVSLLTLAVTIGLGFELHGHDAGAIEFQPAKTSALYFQPLGISFHLGINWIGYWLVLLTALLTPLAILASFGSIQTREKEYYAWMQALLVAMIGVFIARDLLLFYVFFELTLIPMFFIIGIWGGPERRYAAAKFFLFTFAGSVFTLAAAIYLGLKAGSFDFHIAIPYAQTLPANVRFWLFLGFLAGFSVKVPLFPVHTWLPLAHTEAPTAGSVILAGVLLKLGTYGLLAVALPIGLIVPGQSVPQFPVLVQVIGALCVVGIIYGALVAWVQQDIKKLVAYSSVSHLGFCVLGMMALSDIGIQGSVLYMINHGLNTGALFLVIGMIYDRYHTRDIDALSGLARRMPRMAFFFVLFVLASIGLPGLNGFWNEFLTILGAFNSEHLGVRFGVLAATGIVLGAIYMLHMTARVIWGPLKTPEVHGTQGEAVVEKHGNVAVIDHGTAHHHDAGAPGDLTGREMAILMPIAVLVVVLGVWPNLLIDPMRRDVKQITGTDRNATPRHVVADGAAAPPPVEQASAPRE
jgi:NADH-quinone oxidoreductase subunit M